MESAMRKTSVKKEPFLVTAFGILVVLYLAHKLLPTVGYYMPSIVYLAIFAGIAGLLMTSTSGILKSSQFVKLLSVFTLTFFSLIVSALSSDLMSTAMNLYGELQIFLYGWITLWYLKRPDPAKSQKLLYVIIGCYVITAITTYIGNISHSGASRLLATMTTSDALYRQYTSQNIGSFSFIYELILILPLLVYVAKSKRIKTLLGIVAVAIAGLTILESEYTTALMLFVATLLLFVIPRLTAKKIIFILVLCLIVVGLGSSLIASCFDSLSEIIPSETISARFEYIAATLRGEELEDTEGSGDRMVLYEKAINTILETKFMGNWTGEGGSGHSLILDTVVKYGLIGIMALVVTYTSIYKFAIYPHRYKDYYPYLVWIYLVAIFLAVLNPKANLFVFICVIPLFARTIDDMKKGEENREITVDSE